MNEPIKVTILPTAIWIENGFGGERVVVVQHQGMEAFDYAVFNYRYGYTDNASTNHAAIECAKSIGATEPIEQRSRAFPAALAARATTPEAPEQMPARKSKFYEHLDFVSTWVRMWDKSGVSRAPAIHLALNQLDALYLAALATHPAHVGSAKHWCETCEGLGHYDATLGSDTYNASRTQECPDCDGKGYWVAAAPAPASAPVGMGVLLALTKEKNKLHTALELACNYLTDEQAAEVAAAMPVESQQPAKEAKRFSCYLERDFGKAPCDRDCGKLRCMYPSEAAKEAPAVAVQAEPDLREALVRLLASYGRIKPPHSSKSDAEKQAEAALAAHPKESQ